MPSAFYKDLRSISVLGVNGKNSGAFTIGTTENGTESFHPVFVIAVLNTSSGIVVTPILNIGTNASVYNNIQSALALTNLTGAGSMTNNMLGGSSLTKIAAGTTISGNITTIATATTFTFDLHIFGFYN